MNFRIGNFGLIHDVCGNTVGRVDHRRFRDNLDRTRGWIDPDNTIKDNFERTVGTIGKFGLFRDDTESIFEPMLPKPVPPFELPKPFPDDEWLTKRPLFHDNVFGGSRCRKCGNDPCTCYPW